MTRLAFLMILLSLVFTENALADCSKLEGPGEALSKESVVFKVDLCNVPAGTPYTIQVFLETEQGLQAVSPLDSFKTPATSTYTVFSKYAGEHIVKLSYQDQALLAPINFLNEPVEVIPTEQSEPAAPISEEPLPLLANLKMNVSKRKDLVRIKVTNQGEASSKASVVCVNPGKHKIKTKGGFYSKGRWCKNIEALKGGSSINVFVRIKKSKTKVSLQHQDVKLIQVV